MEYSNLTKKEQVEINEALDNFGLDEKEKSIFLTLTKTGSNTITPLAKASRLPVTTVQSVLSRLEKKELLFMTSRRSRHVYEAAGSDQMKKLLEKKLQELSVIAPILKKLNDNSSPAAKVRIFYRERMSEIFLEALEAKDKMVYEVVSARDIQRILGEKFHFTRRRVAKGVHLKSLRVEKFEIKRYNRSIHLRELREAKFLPPDMDFLSSLMLWDDKTAIFSSYPEALAIIVESASLANMFRQFFELAWSVSRRMETIPER